MTYATAHDSPIEGRQFRIEPLDPELQASELYRASHDSSETRRIVSIPWVRAIPTKLECPSRVCAVWKPFFGDRDEISIHEVGLSPPTLRTNKAKPPQHHTEATRKCPLLLNADTRNPLRSHYFNSLGQCQTCGTLADFELLSAGGTRGGSATRYLS